MDALFVHRGDLYPYAVLRKQEEFGFCEYDIVAPPRRFFSGLEPSLPIAEIGVDARRLTGVATPAELLTASLSDGDSWSGQSRRSIAKLFAWFLVCEDPQKRLESREVQTLAHQASLVQHVLDSPALGRVLIADEVGLGKTVEAGLIVGEILQKQPGARVLYLSPARLAANVHREFARLGLRFRRWTSGEGADANLTDEKIIASIHRAAHEGNLDNVIAAPGWDVLIVDECHHLSNYAADGSKPLRQYQLVQKLIEKRPDGRVILMSGTPHQGNPDRFRNLLRLLRREGETEEAVAGRVIYRTKEDVCGWFDEPLFPLRQVNAPRIVPITKPYADWLNEIHRFYVPEGDESDGAARSARQRAAGWRCAQALQWAASSVHAGLGYLVRQAIRLGWESNRPELLKALEAIRPYRLGPSDEPVTLLFARIRKETQAQAQTDEVDDIEDVDDEVRWKADPERLGKLLLHAVELLKAVGDSKWEFIEEHILRTAGADQIVLFAQPIETVTALAAFLQKKTNNRPALIIGGQGDAVRDAEVKRFWSGETQYLVSSRAGSEGINLQCAHRLVHVDVPWNPMEMEQRVGRVHRFGSTRTIEIDTVVLERTREERAYAVAYERLKQITKSLVTGQERFEELFARVMSLIPPAELQDVMASSAMGPLSQDESARIASLVETGFNSWRTFHDRYHAEKKLRAPEPGQATWDDLARFAKLYAKAKAVKGFASLRFERRDKSEIVSSLDEIPVIEMQDGSLCACADVGGRPIIGGNGPGATVSPAGLNTPAIATAIREAAFPAQPAGAAFLRWADNTDVPSDLKDQEIGVLAVARLAVRAFTGSGWDELRAELHVWKVDFEHEATELQPPDSGRLLRSVIAGSIRTKPDSENPLIGRLKRLEIELLQRYRVRSESDASSGTRYAVFPIFAGLISP
jgi:superfamily II DNA or RNA helicase